MTATFQLAGFTLQVLRRQFPESHDVWDGNWLEVKCTCKSPERLVEATGPFVCADEIETLLHTLDKLQAGSGRRCDVHFIEPELDMTFELDTAGGFQFHILLMPDTHKASCKCSYVVTKSELQVAIDQCKQIIRSYPVRGLGEATPVTTPPARPTQQSDDPVS